MHRNKRHPARMIVTCLLMTLMSLGYSEAQGNQKNLLHGIVRDETGAAVASAKVVLLGQSSSSEVTNEKGEFTLSAIPNGTVQVQVSAAGFETQTVEWRPGSDRIEVVLRPIVPGQEITVSANRTGTRLVDTPTSVVVLSA